MSTLPQEEMVRLAELSSLELTDSELKTVTADLSRTLDSFDSLLALDTAGVEPTYRVGTEENVWRPDEVMPLEADREGLLALAPAVEDYQIKVPKVL